MRIFFAIFLLGLGSLLPARTLLVALPPQAEIATALAGEGWTVQVALPPGVDHENFAPTPGQMRRLHEADLYWASGMGFERLLLPRLRALHSGLVVVEPVAEGAGAHEGHDHAHCEEGHADLHRWLNPALVREDADALTAALVRLDPAGAEAYAARLEAFAATCTRLEADLRATLRPFAGEALYVYHAAFGHLAELGGLEQVALERDGREPSLRDLRTIIERARAEGVRVVYVQPQHHPVAAQTLARTIGAEVVSLDPLAPDWEANLRRLAERFASDLRARREGGR